MGVTAVVLAGGRSTRMGSDKASLMLLGRSLLQRAVDAASQVATQVVVVVAPGRPLPSLEARSSVSLVSDAFEGAGPLAGIVRGLEAAEEPTALLLACDQPFVQPDLLRLLASKVGPEVSAAVPVHDRRPQPLLAAVRSDVLPALQAAHARGLDAASVVADLEGARLVQPREWRRADPDRLSFVGVNTPEEFARAEVLAARLG